MAASPFVTRWKAKARLVQKLTSRRRQSWLQLWEKQIVAAERGLVSCCRLKAFGLRKAGLSATAVWSWPFRTTWTKCFAGPGLKQWECFVEHKGGGGTTQSAVLR